MMKTIGFVLALSGSAFAADAVAPAPGNTVPPAAATAPAQKTEQKTEKHVKGTTHKAKATEKAAEKGSEKGTTQK